MITTIVGGRTLGPSGQLLTPAEAFEDGLTISDDRIAPPTAAKGNGGCVVDGDGLIVSPGFIDLQINGGFGIDLLSDPDGMWELGRKLPRHGVTSFLPTIITSPPDRTRAALRSLEQRPADHAGAQPLGLHFEGPMLSPRRPGAHPVRHLAAADSAVISGWSRSNGVVVVTIAPELENAEPVIRELVRRGVTVSAGHSEATAGQALAGIEAGVTMVTHLFNAMSPLGHRDPNLVGVTLARADLPASVIIDGVHVDPEIVAAVWNAKGAAGVVVITDAVSPMGMRPGTYRFGGMTTRANENEVRTSDGILAGSVLTMDRAVRNLLAFTGCQPGHALSAATATPAGVIGETGRGRLETGAVADLVLLNEDLDVQATFCRGRIVHLADGARGRMPAELLEGL